VPTTRVLVVDDDEGIRELLGAALAFAGFEAETVGTVAGALTAMRERPPSILVLDVMLPDADGLEMLRLLRASGDRTPVLFLSARDALADRMSGFAVGGDDYVTKPFDLGEVVARIRAVLRRSGRDGVRNADADAGADADVLRYADLVVDTARMTVHRAGRRLELSPTELRLLVLLAAAPERVVSKAQLLDRLWSYDFGGDASVIEKVVSRLRRKLDPPDLPPLLRTVRGFGYALRADAPEPGDRDPVPDASAPGEGDGDA
jgi:two-component system OmpR family response regulator